MTYKCKGICTLKKNIKKYDLMNGLPPSVKNRDLKKKCRNCGKWMIINSFRCFCCRQQLTTKKARASVNSRLERYWKHNYPTFAELKMLPIHVEMEIRLHQNQ